MPSNVGHLEATLGLNSLQFTSGLQRAKLSMRNASRQMRQIGKNMSLMVSLPLVLVGGAVVKMAANFEKSMSKIEGQVGIARTVVQGMTKDVLALAGPTARAPQELADALFFVTSAGLRGADAMEVLRLSARGAAAGFGDTKIVADLVTSATNAYGIANLSAAEAMDTLAAAVREGKAEAVNIAGAMGMVLPIASNLGVSFNEVGAAIAAMSRTGTNAGTAVIQLRQILASILKPTQQSEQAFGKMGTSSAELRDVLGEEGGLLKLLTFLREEMKTNDLAFTQAFPNIRALSGALDIMGKNAEDNIGIFKRMADNTGDADRAFAAAANTASHKFNEALSLLKVAGIKIGNELMPIFVKLAQFVAKAAKWFGNLSVETKRMIIIVAGLAAAIGPLVFVLGTLGTVIAALTGPIGLVILAVAILAAAALFIVDNWEVLKERLSDWSWWRNTLLSMAQFGITTMTFAFTEIVKLWNKMVIAIGKIDLFIVDPFELMKDGLESLKVETTKYEHEFGSFRDAIVNGANKIKNALSGLFPTGGGGAGGEAVPGTPAGKSGGGGKQFNFGSGGFDFSNFGVGAAAGMKLVVDTISEGADEVKKIAFDLGTAMQNVLNTSFIQFAETLGDIFSGDSGASGFFNNLLLIVANFAASFGKALIAAGVAALAFEKLLINPIAAIAAGIALIVAATVVKNILTKGPTGGMQGLRSGGFVTQGGMFQLHKDEVVSLPLGAAVTPAGMAGQGGGTLTTEINLRKLIIQLDRERQRMGR